VPVFRGIWFIAAGAPAGVLGPGAVVALSGCPGTAVAIPLAASWTGRAAPVAGRT
jgi:hypothetical protein